MKEKKVIGPILGCLVFVVIGFVVYQVIGAVIGSFIGGLVNAITGADPGMYTEIGCILAIIIYLLVYQGANKKVFDGCIKSDKMGLGFLICLPVLILGVIGLIITKCTTDHQLGFTVRGIVTSLYAGICEEIVFRAVPVAHMMRCYDDEKKLPIVVILTAALFSATHAMNLFSGADKFYTLIQLLHTFAVGILYGAAYLRCGSIVPCIVLHFINDVIAFLDLSQFSDGGVFSDGSMLTTADIVTGIVSVIVFVVVGIYAIRPAKRGEIIELWSKKWSKVNTPSQ